MGPRLVRRRRSQGGNAIIELAIVFPLLVFIGMGVAEFGQYLYVKNVFEAAARDVARLSIPTNATQGDPVTTATRTFAQANITFNPSWMTIYDDGAYGCPATSDVSQVDAGNCITVVIQLPYYQVPNVYRPLFQLTGIGVGNGAVVMGKCTTVKE